MLPPHLQQLTDELGKLPGVGPKTALRYVFFLLNLPKNELEILSEKIKNLQKFSHTCSVCFNFSSEDPCFICRDKNRDKNLLCVVANGQDLNIIESTGEHKGLYHVLGGVLNPLEGITADKLKIKELRERLESNGIKEVILALNPDMQGETTMLYLKRMIQSLGKPIKLTRLARGLPVGATVEYADEVTLTDALKDRKEM